MQKERTKAMAEYMPEATRGDKVIDQEIEKSSKEFSKALTAHINKRPKAGQGHVGDEEIDKKLAKDAKEIREKMWKHYKVDQYGDKVVNKQIAKTHEEFAKALNDEWKHAKKRRRVLRRRMLPASVMQI